MSRKIVSITKSFSICYGHKLPFHKGKCRNGHGHNSRIDVTVVMDEKTFQYVKDTRKAEKASDTGMIIDFGDLKVLAGNIIDPLDHMFLNDLVKKDNTGAVSMLLNPPTAENICLYLFEKIKPLIKTPAVLQKIRVYETDDSYAEVEEKV